MLSLQEPCFSQSRGAILDGVMQAPPLARREHQAMLRDNALNDVRNTEPRALH